MKKIIIAFLFTILFISCDNEKIIYIDDDLSIAPRIVLNSVLNTESDTSYFYLTKSRPIFGSKTETEQVNKSGYPMIDNAELHLIINNKQYTAGYSKKDSAYILPGRLQIGDHVLAKVIYEDKEIKSETVVPASPEVISLDTSRIQRVEDSSIIDYVMFNIKIKDNPETKDFYRLSIKWDLYDLDCGTEYDHPDYYYYYYYGNYYTNDPLLMNANNNIYDDWSYRQYMDGYPVFRDVTFSGKEKTLTFYLRHYTLYAEHFSENQNIKNRIRIFIETTSEDLYKYYASFKNMDASDVSETHLVHSNIEGGRGIFGACNRVKVFEYIHNPD